MKIITRIPKQVIALLIVLMLLSSVILLKGCGGSDSATGCTSSQIAPYDATITVTGGFSGSAAEDTPVLFTATVYDKDGAPMNNMCLAISGSFAYPRNLAATGWHYTFHSGASPYVAPAVDSPFTAETGDGGYYDFSAIYSVATGTFTDTVTVRSGAATPGTVAFAVN
jgi:hypothetical protein